MSFIKKIFTENIFVRSYKTYKIILQYKKDIRGELNNPTSPLWEHNVRVFNGGMVLRQQIVLSNDWYYVDDENARVYAAIKQFKPVHDFLVAELGGYGYNGWIVPTLKSWSDERGEQKSLCYGMEYVFDTSGINKLKLIASTIGLIIFVAMIASSIIMILSR